ncbi:MULTISPECIES: hypothetical protein [unclassified Pseudomonas]|uniref:hypothetical protein n=1 Tax=unclassified Pseudomonas TaxID=196821 RepID=UPI000D99AAD4|nr:MULTISPECIES: hypothetical protein [unclassified Pseudomonas]PVZ44018.1 hypothetical protein N430_00501 [Pseudomonas sp. CC120222-01a]
MGGVKAFTENSRASSTIAPDDLGKRAPYLPTPSIDVDSFSQLREVCAELREYYELERCSGRASWLSEILEDVEAIIVRLKPSQTQ